MNRILISTIVLSASLAYSAGPAPTQRSARQVLILRPVPAQGPALEFDYRFGNAVPPFEKEPALEGKEIARGLIPTVPPTPLIRNITDRELYLKADHGRDFTTGPLATYKSQCRDGIHVSFENVRVFSERGPLAIPYTVSVNTYQHLFAGRLFVQSGWSGSLELDGRSWRFTIVDNLDGQIDDQDRLFLRDMQKAPGVRTHDCPVPQILFLNGHTFQMDYAFQQAGSDVVLEAGMTEVQVPTGELKLEAGGCCGVVLREDRRIVLLDGLEGTLSVPAGRYQIDNCLLEHKPDQWRIPQFAGCEQAVSVQPGQTTSLRMGCPLSNVIAVTRDRNLLHLKYRLTGAGGELYEYEGAGSANPPLFRVYKGPMKVASSAFGGG